MNVRCYRMTLLGYSLCLCVSSGLLAQQNAAFEKAGSGYRVAGSLYALEARADGCLTAFRVGNEDFFPPVNRATAGCYLYQKGVLKLANLREQVEGALSAESDKAVMTYTCVADRARITVQNKTDAVMTLVLLFPPEVSAATGGSGPFRRPPINARWATSTWFRGGMKLKIEGGTRVWAPFSKDLQVWTLDVEGKSTDQVTLVPGAASVTEQEQAAGAEIVVAKPMPKVTVAKPEGDASTKPDSGAAVVVTKALYQATVSSDGCLTSLKVEGEELLHERGSNPRGAYLFQGGAFGLPDVTQPKPDTIVAAGTKAQVTYTFSPTTVRWQIRNLTEKKLITLMAFAPGIRVVRDSFGQYEKTPAKLSSPTIVGYAKKAKLEIANGGRIWGPWSDENLQIWQNDLKAGEEHTTVFSPGLATADELADVEAALNYVAVPPTDPEGPMWDLAKLSSPPSFRPAEGIAEEGVDAVFYDGRPYRGRPTEVFAWLGIPDVPADDKVPGMVLIHGGGGTAFAEWVRLWNGRGYAAIAMDTCGSVPGGKPGQRPRHAKGGPDGWGGYGQIDRPREDQWAYHAIADVILAHSLLRSRPGVDPDRIGVTGISWGGYLCSMTAGVDTRFRFAIPVYGCGFTTDHNFAGSVTGLGEERAARWMRWWDPSAYLAEARMPMLWVTGSNDFAYTFPALQKSYRLPKTSRTLCIRLRMPHGHTPGWAPKEIEAFAESVLNGAQPLIRVTEQGCEDGSAWTTFESVSPVVKAELNVTFDTGPWKERKWKALPARLEQQKASAQLPGGTTVYYLNLTDDRGLLVSTEHVEVMSK
jgi:dienelactone hydrolase